MPSQARRRRRDALLKGLQEAHARLQMYARGAASCASGDVVATAALQRHLLRGPGGDAVDLLLLYQEVCCCGNAQAWKGRSRDDLLLW